MSMITYVLLYVLLVLSSNIAYDFSCPSHLNWKLRAESTCMQQSNYSCLYDVNLPVNVYRDKCIGSRIVGPGFKYVFQPNPNRATCRITRYQPFIFNTTGYSDCAYLKSICSGEGQTAIANGTTRSDRTCTCNAETGYTFITNPRKRCYCNPSSEDCSCYIHLNPSNTVKVSKDVNCEDEMNLTETRLHEDLFNISREPNNYDFDNYKYNLNYLPTNKNRIEAAKWILMLFVAHCVVCGIFQMKRRIWDNLLRLTRIQRKEKVTCLLEEKDTEQKSKVKMNKLKIEQEDPVPSNIREQMRQEIDIWAKQSEKFICTRAYMEVLANICSKSCVAVTGPGGSGKTSIVHTVAISLSTKENYEITIILNPNDMRNYYKPGRKTLFVLDDVCGRFTANGKQINDWNSMQMVVNQVIQDDSCKILFSCRLQVYKDPKFALLEPFKLCECNIISSELCLSKNEKKKMFVSHLNSEIITDSILSKQIDNFPLLCQLRAIGKNDLNIDKFFDTPYEVLKEELDKLYIKGKEKLCGLCLCIVYNNQLNETFFQVETDEFSEIIQDIGKKIGLNKQITPTSMKKELDILEKTYIIKRDGLYMIFHDTLFDFMAHYFGQKMAKCFIDHADSGFLRERFLWINAFDTQSAEYNIENIIWLEDVYLELYINRIISDWTSGKVSDALYNINMKSSLFRSKFLQRLNQLNGLQARVLSQMKDDFRKDYASGNTPLIISSLDGFVDLLKWLLTHEANVNDCRHDGSSALYMGCVNNNVDIVKILLDNDADVNICTQEGVSPLGITCTLNGNVHIVDQLLQKKAEVNKHTFQENNMTPLFTACANNYIPTVHELLKQNADPNICVSNGMSALLDACQKNYIDVVKLLIEYKADPNAKMEDGDTPLFSASWMGYETITDILLKNGADPYNCLSSKEEIFKLIEDTPQSVEDEKKIWFDVIATIGSDIVKAYINTKSADYIFDVFAGSSPLHVACFMGQIEVIKLLTDKLEKVVDIRKADGTTPLFYACEVGHLDVIRILVNKGADPNMNRVDGYSPLTIARINGHTEVLSFLT